MEGSFKDVCSIRIYRAAAQQPLLWLWVDVIDISRFCTGIANGLMGIGIVLTDRELSGYLGPVLNMFVTIPVNFVMNKFWAYRQKE